MRKLLKKMCAVLLTSALIGGFALTSYAADASVTYEGGAEDFVFLPGSQESADDLFDNLKDVMPGDTVSQTIKIQNNYGGSDYVDIYVRAEAHDGSVVPADSAVSMKDFLSKLSMRVYHKGKLVYDASPDELAGFGEPVKLGSFEYGESTELKVELTVPIELGNEYANRIGVVDWVFTAEKYDYPTGGGGGSSSSRPSPGQTTVIDKSPEPPWITILPKTGDGAVIWPYLLLLFLGAAGVIWTLAGKKKEKQK